MVGLVCLRNILALSLLNAHLVHVQSAVFIPPNPREGQGFNIPLDIATLQPFRSNPVSSKRFAALSMFDSRELWVVHSPTHDVLWLYDNITAYVSAYLVPISVGDQNFMFTLDTASSDLWVASSDCIDQDCQAVEKYHKSPSLTLTKNPFLLKYVQGTVSGAIGYETVVLGETKIYDQVLGIVTNVSSINLSAMRNSGILGLSFPKSSSIQRSAGKTFVENLFAGLDENSRFFAFQLARSGSAAPSSFTIGQVDSFALSNTSLSYFPVYPLNAYTNLYDYWKLPLHHISINGIPLPFPLSWSRVKGTVSPIAVLDTGTSLILGPVRDVDNLWKTIGGAIRDPQTGFWMIRCNRGISAGFAFGGIDRVEMREYFVHPFDMSWNATRSGGLCLAGIQGNDKVISGDWLLGDIFLRNVYVTHHAATAESPPLIGLGNLTDPETATVAFYAERGQDDFHQINFVPHAKKSPTPILISSAATGFAVGLLVVLAVKLNVRKVCRQMLGRRRFPH